MLDYTYYNILNKNSFGIDLNELRNNSNISLKEVFERIDGNVLALFVNSNCNITEYSFKNDIPYANLDVLLIGGGGGGARVDMGNIGGGFGGESVLIQNYKIELNDVIKIEVGNGGEGYSNLETTQKAGNNGFSSSIELNDGIRKYIAVGGNGGYSNLSAELSYIYNLTGMDDWVKIKHSPTNVGKISGNTFSGATIDGTFTIGDATDDTAEWAITFDATNVEYFCFHSKDSDINSDFKDRWVVIERSEMIKQIAYQSTGGYGYNSLYPHYYKTTFKPDGFVAKTSTYYTGGRRDQIIYNRLGASFNDPEIATYFVKNDGTTIDPHTNSGAIATDFSSVGQIFLYLENQTNQLLGIEQSVYVKYTADTPLPVNIEPQDIPGTTDYKTLTFTYQNDTSEPVSWVKNSANTSSLASS